ncbi:uncharacterized protein rab44 [Tachysurus ichikawai]
MSSRKSKRGQKLGSSRRNKNRNQETEEKDNDDGYQDPGKEEHESECQFLTVSENQSSNESSLLHPDQQVVVCTSPSSSVLEFSPQPQSQEFNVVLPQADITGKKRKMGSTRKGNRNFKFEEISEDEPEHRVQLSEGVSDEQKVDEEASIKEYGGKEDQTSLMDLKESFILQEKHFGLDIIMQNEGHSKNYEYRHLEAALQSKHMDISSSEPNQSNEAEFSQDLMHDQSNLNCIINDTLEVTGVQSASLIYEHEHMTEDDKKATVIWDNVNNKASTEDGKTSKERKIGLNQKSNRNVKFEGVYMDEHEHSIQLSEGVSDEQKIILDSPIKEDGGKENQTSLMDCSHSQSSESLSSVLQGKHFGLDTIMQNEDHSKNDKYHHLEEAVQSKPMDIFSSEPNQSKEAEFSQDLKHDQSSLNVMVKGTLEGSHAEDIVQDEVTGVQSASLIYEHEHMPKDDKMSTVIWENVNSKASTEDEKTVEHCLEHKDKPLQLPEESIYKSESTEVREDTDEYKEVSAAWDRTDNDSYEGLTKTNLNQTMVPDTNIVSHLKMKDQELGTSSEQILSDEFQFQGDSEIKCYREEKNDLSEARCWSGKSSADEKKGNAKNEVDMHYNEEKYRATGTEREVEYDDMQSANSNQLLISKGSSTNMFDSVSESEHIPAKTLYGATESNSKTCNLQHNNPKEFPTELEMKSKEGNCSDQMAEKVDEDRSEFSDIETEVAGEENNDIKEEIHAISTESFTKEDFKRVDDEKDDMSTFMNELEMASVITNIQDYAITGQASIVIEDHGIESPDKRSTCPYLDSVELIHETQVKLDIPVYNPIPDQKQNMYDDCQVYPTNAEQFESTFPIVYMQESRQVEDNSASENLRFNPSKKNKIDSFQRNLSGQNSGGDQNAMEETIQVQSLEESTPFSEDETLNFTAETCYHHSLNMIEPEAKKIDENVIKAEHLVDTEVLKMQSRTEVAESIIQNEETTWERDKHNQPISLEDLRQNTYPDLTLEQSKTWECAEIVTDRINTDHSVTFAEPIDAAEEEHLLEEKILQATPTTIPSTNSNRRKMGSICKTLGEKKNEKDKEEDMYVEEKDMAFTKRSMLLGPETGAREEKDNDRKKEINAGHRGKLKTEAEYTQQYMYSEISSQTVLSFQTTIKHSSSPTEHTDFRKDNKNSIENVESRNAEIQLQTQTRKKKKIGSTRRPGGKHKPPPEGEEGEWKELENAEEIEHQLITQDVASSLINEPQNTMSEVTPNIHDSTVTTEQIEIITTDVETGTGGIEAAPAMLSIEVDQINTVASHEVGNAEGLTDTIEQKEKSAVHEVRDSVVMHLDEQEITPVVTKIQDDALIEHVSLTVRMHDNEICDNECASRANVHPTCENVDNSNSEIQTERPHKKKKKFGSTRRPRGGHQPPPEGEEEEWKDLENTEEIQCIDQTASSNLLTELENAISESLDTHSQLAYPIQLIPETQAILDMPVVSEQYHTMFEEPLENPKNNESEKEQCDITCPVVHIQELNLAPDYMAKQSSGDSNSGRRKKIGSTRRSLRLIKEKENIQEQTSGESTPNSAKDNGQKGAYHLTAEISHQSIQTHSDPLNIIEHEAEEMGSTCKNLEEGQSKQEAWQRSTDMSPRYVGDYDKKYLKFVSNEDMVNTESSSCDKKASVQEYKTKIHQKLDQSEGSLLSEIELYLNKSFENTLIPTVLNPNISEFLEPMFEGSLQLPSSQNPQIYMEQSSPSRKRKMGSSRKMPRNKHEEKTLNESEGPEQEKENLNKNRVKNSEPKTEAKLVEKTVMAEGTEDMKESAELMSEVQALSEINESSTQVTEQPFPEGRRKFGSRRTRKGCSGLGAFTHGDYESNQENTDIQMTKDLRVSDPCFISEPKSPPISHQVSEARPGTEVVTKVKDTNISPDADLVSLDSNRKTSPSVVSTGIRQKIDFEQWNEQIPDFGQLVYNIVMVGNSSVGKTSFIKRLQSGHFIPDYSSTIGVDTFVHTVTFGSKTVKLYVWDTAGQERYHSITRQVFHKAQGLLLMYDITSSQSFHAVRAWISQIQENAHPDVILMLLGNKNDCADREVPLHEGETLSKEYDIHFMECSVATGENVSESLKTLAWLLMKQRVKKEEEHKTLQPKPQQNKKSGCC